MYPDTRIVARATRSFALVMSGIALVALLLGLALVPHAVRANQTPVSVCVEALEQLETLYMAAPVYKLTGGQERQYLADAGRPAEVDRLKTIVAETCTARCADVDLSDVWLIHKPAA